MSKSNKTQAIESNYSKEQVTFLTDNSPMDWAQAQALGKAWGKSAQSIVSKIKNLDLEYTVKPAPRKKAVQATKAELLAKVSERSDTDLSGLIGGSRAAILALLTVIQHNIDAPVSAELPEAGDSVVTNEND